MASIKLNGQRVSVDAAPDTPLLWVIRDHLNLTGTKFGCGVASCGACTILVDGEPMRSCQFRLEDAEGVEISTIEGQEDSAFKNVQAAWRELDVVQCGYCQSGQVMAAAALIRSNPKPTDEDIDEALNGNLCRCGTYQRIRAAVHLAAEKMEA
ncbi:MULTISPECIES: (2Fe-2S)-binding protein [Kordiimonas]|uniref:(2Fe-2S)-binding protein n=1 Tax=Kordiimonas TaxID=288021 RepID=UPI001FF6CD2A|nr:MULTISPECIES: (2Fe-2S)-binding protein [Kordiimonas]MCK0068131.1 (2Fe-2S)-binding protein [Kordiimonas laminariae]UTW59898.1 (2Fe-2S)-binding protein [Kordiimonas sp. SCSIO 12603]